MSPGRPPRGLRVDAVGKPRDLGRRREQGSSRARDLVSRARIETPRWSPDGRRLVFSAREGARARLYTIAAAGGVAEALPTGDADAVAPAWSHDGRAIYFASRRSGASRVWRLDLASRALTAATGDGGYAAQESSDGSALFYTRADAAGIWRVANGAGISAGPPERVVATLAPEDWANWQVTAAGLYYRELCGDHPDPGSFTPLPAASRRTWLRSPRRAGPASPVSADGKPWRSIRASSVTRAI